jgi:hypothetical protein
MSVIIFLPEGLIYNTFGFNALYTLIFSKQWKYHESTKNSSSYKKNNSESTSDYLLINILVSKHFLLSLTRAHSNNK